MSHIEKEKLIKADIASIENRVRHAFNQGYDLGFKDGKERAKPLEQETQTFKWCETCKEYDQEKHCCHRWSKVIRDTVEEMKQEPRWIPVSERLPDTDDEVLCWYEYYHWSQGKVLPEYGLGRYLKETSAWFGEVANGHEVRVIAWMPLPQPYSEVEE